MPILRASRRDVRGRAAASLPAAWMTSCWSEASLGCSAPAAAGSASTTWRRARRQGPLQRALRSARALRDGVAAGLACAPRRTSRRVQVGLRDA